MSTATETPHPGSTTGADPAVLLHDAEETSRRLGGVVTANWLKRKAGLGLIPHTRLGLSAAWSDADIAELIRDNYCDPHNYSRKRGS